MSPEASASRPNYRLSVRFKEFLQVIKQQSATLILPPSKLHEYIAVDALNILPQSRVMPQSFCCVVAVN